MFSATTAKPLPASPALTDSIEALITKRLVRLAALYKYFIICSALSMHLHYQRQRLKAVAAATAATAATATAATAATTAAAGTWRVVDAGLVGYGVPWILYCAVRKNLIQKLAVRGFGFSAFDGDYYKVNQQPDGKGYQGVADVFHRLGYFSAS